LARQETKAAATAHAKDAERVEAHLKQGIAQPYAGATDAAAASAVYAGRARAPGCRGRRPRPWRSPPLCYRVEACRQRKKRPHRGRPTTAEGPQLEQRYRVVVEGEQAEDDPGWTVLATTGGSEVGADAETFHASHNQISLEEQVALALKKRPDFVRSQLEVATREIARDFARNQRLPRLDIVSRFSVQAFGEGFDESTGRLRNAEGYAWTIGLRFEQPLGNRFANNELLKRELELRQTLVDQQLLLTIVQEVAQAIRDIETFKEEVEVTRAGTELARSQLEAEQEKFRLGLTTSFNVLELQEDLSIARTDETRALSDYNIALARLEQLTGKLQYDAMASTTK
jgi:hypothetical protein